MKHHEFFGTLAAKKQRQMLPNGIPMYQFTASLYSGTQKVETPFQIFGERGKFLEPLAVNTTIRVTCVLPSNVKLTRKGLPASIRPVLAWRIDEDATGSQQYVDIINSLSESDLEIMAVSFYPKQMKEMLLRAPLSTQKAIVADFLKKDEIISNLNEDDLDGIGDSILPEEMREMLICSPLTVQKEIIDEFLQEQARIEREFNT
jgi:hypothetical protein